MPTFNELPKADLQKEIVFPAVVDPDGDPSDGSVTLSDMIDAVWDKLYKRPVIVQCGYCHCHNAFSNVACVQCGAPMGEYENAR